MAFKFVIDKGPFYTSLRDVSLFSAIFFLVIMAIGIILNPKILGESGALVGFLILILCNLALLFGALRANQWLVLIWLIQPPFFFIGWPIAFLGVIFNFGGYRTSDNILVDLLAQIISLVIFAFATRIVFSFWYQLRYSQKNPQHTDVV